MPIPHTLEKRKEKNPKPAPIMPWGEAAVLSEECAQREEEQFKQRPESKARSCSVVQPLNHRSHRHTDIKANVSQPGALIASCSSVVFLLDAGSKQNPGVLEVGTNLARSGPLQGTWAPHGTTLQ